MSTSYEIIGTVKVIMPVMTFPSGFYKREFVITTEDEQYPQPIKFTALKERASLLDVLVPNERVKVRFDIRGNQSTKNENQYFVDLQVYQIEKLDGDGGAVTVDPMGPPINEDEPMPF